MTRLEPKFNFAGFTFPRYIPELSTSKYDKRTSRSVYYTTPTPLVDGMNHPGKGFYLADHGSFDRWKWCDEVVNIRHSGWYSDEYGDAEKIRGLVVRLPHNKFLAGWSMGEGMCSEVDGELYTDEKEAAYAADSIAENAAEREREYQEEQRRIEEEEEANQGSDEEETEGY